MQHETAARLPLRRVVLLPVVAAGLLAGHAAIAGHDPCSSAPGSSPATPPERFACASGLVRAGDHPGAIRAYQALSAEFPGNVDYLFGEAQARFWSGDAQGALPLLRRARGLAPEYEDVRQLEQQVLAALGEDGGGAAGEPARVRWESGATLESLDNGADDWRHFYAHVGRRWTDERNLWATLARHERFGLTDTELSLGGALAPAAGWLLEGTLHTVPDADFLPERVAGIGVNRAFEDGWIAGIDLERRRYPGQAVTRYGFGLERYFGRYRAAAELQRTRLHSTSAFVYSATLNYYADHGSRYGITLAAGDEVEIVAPGELLEMDIRAVSLTGSHPLGGRLSLLWRVGTHRQGSFYRRNAVGLSLAGEF